MNLIYRILSNSIIEALGLAIIHSLWQGTLIALLLGILMFFTRKFTSVTRYLMAVTALLFMLACPVYTFIKNYNPEPAVNNPVYAVRFPDAPALKADITPTVKNTEIIAESRTTKLKSVHIRDFFSRHFPLIVTIWFAGIIFFTLKFFGALAYTQRLKYYRISQISEEWQKKTRLLCKKLKIGKAVKIYESALARVPMVIGLIKPVILLPVSAFTGLPPKQLESIIVHELAHILRRDYIINLLQSVLEILFFYHPAIWWINNVIRTERENCCDDIAVAQTGDSTNYARALASIQEHLLLKENLAVAAAGNKNILLKRIKRLLNQPKMKTNFIEGFTASCIILLGIFMIVLNANAITERTIENKLRKSEKKISISDTVLSDKLPGKPDSAAVLEDVEVPEDIEDIEEVEEVPPLSPDEMVEEVEEVEQVEEVPPLSPDEMVEEVEEVEQVEEVEEAPPLFPDEIVEEIITGIEQGVTEMNLDLIIDEAMAGIQAGLREMDINAIVREAIRGANEGLQNADINIIVNEALVGIQAAMEQIDLNAIVAEALKEAEKAQKEIEAEKAQKKNEAKEIEMEYDDDEGDCPTFVGNAQHLANLKMGTSHWNTWRAENKNEKVDLRGACLHETALKNMNLSNASLENIDLGEAALDGTDFTGANLTGANLKEAALHQVVFKRAIMEGINFKEVSLNNLDLSEAILTNANLKEVSMNSVDLSNADLRYANLKEASLNKVNFSKADLRGANLAEAAINDCKFDGAIIDNTTLLPPGFSIDEE
jgi:uncharacterized protein YjbI with pentapeptide repeats/beta-lactamase regulating signal transducer with metallopeptidase domain